MCLGASSVTGLAHGQPVDEMQVVVLITDLRALGPCLFIFVYFSSHCVSVTATSSSG